MDIQSALATMAQTLGTIGRSLGTVALEPLVAATDKPVLTVLQAEAVRSNADLLASGVLDSGLEARLEKGRAISDVQLNEARSTLRTLAQIEIGRLFATCDAILLPVMPLTTPRIEACEPSAPTFSGRTLYELSSFTRFVNALGLPAVALPGGFDAQRLPIGLQLVGPPNSDCSLVALAREIQGVSDWHCRLPPVRAD
jgi:Asp-tRNA(Asn)/Glu-tRNA(Gln) amidotransferase A subunit family amidase